jgi:hypothetical protein
LGDDELRCRGERGGGGQLESKGRRCGEGQGCSMPFIRAGEGERQGGAARPITFGVNGLNTIDVGLGLRGD